MDEPMGHIKFVQLEPAAFLTDIDFQMMSAEERGVYCSIIFYLYCNNGELDLSYDGDITLLSGKYNKLATLSGCAKMGSAWESLWGKIADKFQIADNILTHKRVTEELQKAENYLKAKSLAGKKGMESRWGDNTDITKVSKVKKSKEKKSKEQQEYISIFDEARKLFPSTKRGCETEFENFCKKHKNWKDILPLLQPAIENQIKWRTVDGLYWKHFQTWINNHCWEEEQPIIVGDKQISKMRLLPIIGKNCSKEGCGLPAVYKDSSGSYDHWYCFAHMPAKVKEKYS